MFQTIVIVLLLKNYHEMPQSLLQLRIAKKSSLERGCFSIKCNLGPLKIQLKILIIKKKIQTNNTRKLVEKNHCKCFQACMIYQNHIHNFTQRNIFVIYPIHGCWLWM